jgi:hypothetical protein
LLITRVIIVEATRSVLEIPETIKNVEEFIIDELITQFWRDVCVEFM